MEPQRRRSPGSVLPSRAIRCAPSQSASRSRSLRILLQLAAVLCASLAGGCSAEPRQAEADLCRIEGVTRMAADEVAICGAIEPHTYLALVAELPPRARRLRVTSFGGDTDSSLQVGALVRQRDLAVIVDRVCASGCAHFIFLPARRARVLEGGIVAFHGTRTYLVEAARAAGLVIAPEAAARVQEEKHFLEAAGVATEALYAPSHMLRPVCAGVSSVGQRSYIMTTYVAYVPDLHTVERWRGASVEGFWPASAKSAGVRLERFRRRATSVVFGPPKELPPGGVMDLRRCGA